MQSTNLARRCSSLTSRINLSCPAWRLEQQKLAFSQYKLIASSRWSVRIRAQAENQEKEFVVGKIARRTLLVSFKCNLCEGRTDRLVNPLAWNKGAVFLQCKNCETWHAVKDNLNLIEEIRYQGNSN